MKKDYQCSIAAHVTAEEAFDAINDVSAWWAKRVEGYSETIHDVFTVRFSQTFVTFEIIELIPNKRVVWLVTDCFLHWINDKTEWNGNKIIWEVKETEDTTRIDMTHVGLTPKEECFEDCQAGWDHHIHDSLLKLLNEKVGIPE